MNGEMNRVHIFYVNGKLSGVHFPAERCHACTWLTLFHFIMLSIVTFKAKCFQNVLYMVILCKLYRVLRTIRSEFIRLRCICMKVQDFTTSRGTIWYMVLIALMMFLILSQVDASKFLANSLWKCTCTCKFFST